MKCKVIDLTTGYIKYIDSLKSFSIEWNIPYDRVRNFYRWSTNEHFMLNDIRIYRVNN